jgi:Fe-S cluster assembly protein SufD
LDQGRVSSVKNVKTKKMSGALSNTVDSKQIDAVNTNGFQGILPSIFKEKADFLLSSVQFPTTRTEAWKYTRLGKISNKKFSVQKGNVAEASKCLISKKAYNMVFVNGFFDTEQSSKNLPLGIICKNLSTAISEETIHNLIGTNLGLENEIFHLLNTKYATDGAFVHILPGTTLEQSIQIIHISTGTHTVSHIRNVIVAEKNSKSHLIQSYYSENANECFSNVISEVFVKENAHLTIDKIQLENASSYQIATEQVSQEKNSTFTINTLTLNGALVRNNLNIEVKGQNALTHLNGAYLLKENQHADNHTVVDHLAAHCESHELYKGVLEDKSTAVFNGKVFVRKNSQKINAFQSNANVLLSDEATVNSKPELEIYADDVKCSHGSTTGQLDEDAIFYLRARGISEKSARKLIVSAFISDVIEKIDNGEVSSFVQDFLDCRFEKNKEQL